MKDKAALIIIGFIFFQTVISWLGVATRSTAYQYDVWSKEDGVCQENIEYYCDERERRHKIADFCYKYSIQILLSDKYLKY